MSDSNSINGATHEPVTTTRRAFLRTAATALAALAIPAAAANVPDPDRFRRLGQEWRREFGIRGIIRSADLADIVRSRPGLQIRWDDRTEQYDLLDRHDGTNYGHFCAMSVFAFAAVLVRDAARGEGWTPDHTEVAEAAWALLEGLSGG